MFLFKETGKKEQFKPKTRWRKEIIRMRKEISEIENRIRENIFVLYDEITHILSLAKIGKLVILEKTESNIFTKYIDKTNIQDNYVIVNKFVDEILSKYLSENRREKC